MSQENNQRESAYLRMRGTMHVGMGIMYLLVGSLVLYIKITDMAGFPSEFAYILGTMMLLYGIFRLWRGITFMRQRNRRSTRHQ